MKFFKIINAKIQEQVSEKHQTCKENLENQQTKNLKTTSSF